MRRHLLPSLRTVEDAQEEETLQRQKYGELVVVEEELVLYDEMGPYRFLKARMDSLIDSARSALEVCDPSETRLYQARLQTLRHLAKVPEILRSRQAQLKEELGHE